MESYLDIIGLKHQVQLLMLAVMNRLLLHLLLQMHSVISNFNFRFMMMNLIFHLLIMYLLQLVRLVLLLLMILSIIVEMRQGSLYHVMGRMI